MAERAALPGPLVLPAHERESLAAAAAALAAGGIVGLPTETVYGVGVVPRAEALKALVAAKRRPEEKGIALLVDDLAQVEDLVLLGAVARRLAARFWPGPLTLVLPLGRPEEVPALLTGGRASLGVRVPDHAVPRAIARELGPLAVSSANRSGQPDARTSAELLEALGASLALLIDDGPVRGGVPSSVVSVDHEGRCELLREGAVPGAALWAALGRVPGTDA
jgi:L-threonylcarbamoyladenylate synthase